MSEKENTSLTLRLPFWLVGPILMLVIEAISFALDNYQVLGNTLHDYDTVTRMAYLRQVIQRHTLAHGFFDRINAPFGMVLHWTLPFNFIVLAIIKLFSFFVPNDAIHYAGYWTGFIFRVVVGPAAYWAGREVLKPAAAGMASLLILFSPYLLAYAHRGTANHHALMFLETVLMAGLAFRFVNRPLSNLRLPIAIGAMAALCLWTTFEMVIVLGPLFAVIFYLWLIEGETRLRQLLLSTASFSIVMTFALLVDAPYGGYDARILDRVSMPFQTLASIPFLLALGAYFVKPSNEFRRVGYLFLAGLVAGLFWLACYPFALDGVQGAMDPYVAREWLAQIEEVMPIHEWREILFYLGPGVIGALFVFKWHVPRERKEPVLFGLGFLYILGQLHFRFALYIAVAAPYFLAYVYERSRRDNGEFPSGYRDYAKTAALGIMAVYVVVQICALIIHVDVMSEPDKNKGKDDDVPDSVTCNPWLVRKPLSDAAWMGLGKTDPIIINEVNDASQLLYWTDVRTLAGNYHRDSAGIKDDYLFFRDLGESDARNTVRKHNADFVLVCGNGNNPTYSFVSVARAQKEMSKLGDEFDPQNTMYTRLTDEKPPSWLKLKPWPEDIDTDLLLYEVDKSQFK